MTCVHCASSEEVAVPLRAYDPEWTGLPTAASWEEQVQPERAPVSNPGLLTRFVAAVAPGTAARPIVGASITKTAAAA
jgi:hypothetical protein